MAFPVPLPGMLSHCLEFPVECKKKCKIVSKSREKYPSYQNQFGCVAFSLKSFLTYFWSHEMYSPVKHIPMLSETAKFHVTVHVGKLKH